MIGKPGGGAVDRYVLEVFGGGGIQSPSTTEVRLSETALLILKCEFADVRDRFTLYVNPPLDTEPLEGTLLQYFDLMAWTGLSIAGAGAFSLDEIRLGNTFAEVTPPAVGPPVIGTQPSDQSAWEGSSASFSVEVGGALPLSFQWFFNATNEIAGATSNRLALTNVQFSQVGGYSVVVSNAVGVVTSTVATLTIITSADLAEALDATDLVWTTGGGARWMPQTQTTHDGVDAAQSGEILDNQESWLETTVIGPGTLSFWWKVSSEPGFDFMEFAVNGLPVTPAISIEKEWEQQTVPLPPGIMRLHWRYYKDNSISAGLDRAWLDEVLFEPDMVTPYIVVSPLSQAVTEGATASFSVTAGGKLPMHYQWFFYETNELAGATTDTLALNHVQFSDAGGCHVVASNAFGSATSRVATLTVFPVLTHSGSSRGNCRAVYVTYDRPVQLDGMPSPSR